MGRQLKGVSFSYFKPSEIAALGDFKTPPLPEGYKGEPGLWDFETFRGHVKSVPRTDDRHRGYSVAQSPEGVLGYALSGIAILYACFGKRPVEIPDIFAYVHPDYRRRGIGTRLIEELLPHHPLLQLSPTTFPASVLAHKLLVKWGLPGWESEKIIRKRRRKSA